MAKPVRLKKKEEVKGAAAAVRQSEQQCDPSTSTAAPGLSPAYFT